jgi:hypothetical protein
MMLLKARGTLLAALITSYVSLLAQAGSTSNLPRNKAGNNKKNKARRAEKKQKKAEKQRQQ